MIAIKESEGRKKNGENVLKKRPEEASGHDDVARQRLTRLNTCIHISHVQRPGTEALSVAAVWAQPDDGDSAATPGTGTHRDLILTFLNQL